MSSLRKSVLNKPRGSGLMRNPVDFTPLNPSEYFDSEEDIVTNNGSFHIYKKGNTGPILFCLHGGGYSGLTWSLFAVEICKNIECQVIAIDLRGHGLSSSTDDSNLALSTLTKDVEDVIGKIREDNDVPIILIGHSMGGAVAVDAAHFIDSIAGLCVIDVVEGTALEALSSMQNILRGRPSSFKSLENAIQWCFKSGQTRNIEAARVSMPGQVVKVDKVDPVINDMSNNLAIQEEVDECDEIKEENFAKPPLPKKLASIPGVCSISSTPSSIYTWRIDLKKTESFWTGWFQGLSQKFLELQLPKILLLANVNGLDTALTVGQMQGKFQFKVLSKSGHAIHEDQPHQVAEIISIYLVKHKLANPKDDFEVPLPKLFA